VIRELLDGHPDLPALDLSRIVYGGQSQGAIVGSLVAAISSDFDAFVLNGVGGYLASTLVFRTDPIDIERTIKGFLQIQREIDRFHLISVLAQTGVDRVDIHNYAHLWKGHPGRPQGTNVLLINGKQDHTTAFVGMNSLTIAGDVAPIDEPGWDVDPYGVWDRGPEAVPIEGNRTATDGTPITLATYLNVAQGHFTLFRDGYAEKLAINFWASVLDGLPATVEP
jgi:hypothetical protein